MKKIYSIVILLLLSTSCFAHEHNHYAELFSQILFPIALLGCLVCLPLTFLLVISKFNKKFSRLLYGGYVLGALSFFGILRLLYTYIHNHFELTCQIVAFGFYLSLFSLLIYIVKIILFNIKEKKGK